MSSSLFISSLLSSGQQLVWPREILSTIYWPLSEVFYTGKEKKRWVCLFTLPHTRTLSGLCRYLYQRFSVGRPSVPPDSCLWLGVDEKHSFPERTAARLSIRALGQPVCGQRDIWSLQLWCAWAAASRSVKPCNAGHIDTHVEGQKSIVHSCAVCVCLYLHILSSASSRALENLQYPIFQVVTLNLRNRNSDMLHSFTPWW